MKGLSKLLIAIFSLSLLTTTVNAQRSVSKSTKIEVTKFPTIPHGSADKVAFNVHADYNFFNLDDLRRYGGNTALMKSSGERLSGMKYYTVGFETQVVDANATITVDVALGDAMSGTPMIKSEPIKSGSETLTYWALVPYEMPVVVKISDANGNILDGFEVDPNNNIRYGNEKVSERERTRNGFSFKKYSLKFGSEGDVYANLNSESARKFIRRKAVLLQLSKVIDELEQRIYFIDYKPEITVYSAKGKKHDYTALETAQTEALLAYDNADFAGLQSSIDTWAQWASEVNFTDKKAKVNKGIAAGLYYNIAQANLYMNNFDASAEAITQCRGLIDPQSELNGKLKTLQKDILLKRRAINANGADPLPAETETTKALDFKNVIAKRSENNDVEMIYPNNMYVEVVSAIEQWQQQFVSGSAEQKASGTAEQTIEQRLGAVLGTTIGGASLIMSPLVFSDLVGGEMPSEIFDIPNLVYLDISRMQWNIIPADIAKLDMLQTFAAIGNGITELPEEMGELANLKKLLLDNNNLTELPSSLSNCLELKTVRLKGNSIPAAAQTEIQSILPVDCKVKY